MNALWISLALGVVAGLANLFGGAIVTARPWSRTFLTYFIALGSGFMLATAITEMVPESLRLASNAAPMLILAGYFIVHVFEHSWPAHFHFGEETHHHEFLKPFVAQTAAAGLAIHTFFDGVSIASGFLLSNWLGTVISGAVILHNIPEGFTIASVMAAAGKGRSAGLWAAGALGISRILGIFAMAFAQKYVSYGLALSAGVTLYVAASDLIPEVNKRPGPKIALTVAAGVGMLVFFRLVFFGAVTP
ncbi:MAG: ZIP family metal transporter [Acidobacteria bacterium]|nr:ZIP family metal transporter [Acidobacteriota bacterium]